MKDRSFELKPFMYKDNIYSLKITFQKINNVLLKSFSNFIKLTDISVTASYRFFFITRFIQ